MRNGKLTKARQQRITRALGKVPFAKLIGIELEAADNGVATLALEVRRELKQNDGVVHGGAIASLIDTATAFAIISMLGPRERATTVDLTVSYLRPLTRGRATATARVLRAGRRLIVVSAEVRDSAGSPTATALSTYIRI